MLEALLVLPGIQQEDCSQATALAGAQRGRRLLQHDLGASDSMVGRMVRVPDVMEEGSGLEERACPTVPAAHGGGPVEQLQGEAGDMQRVCLFISVSLGELCNLFGP